MLSEVDERSKKSVTDFLKKTSILIVDQNSSARVGLKKLLVTMGASLQKIFQASSFEEAEDLIKSQGAELVF